MARECGNFNRRRVFRMGGARALLVFVAACSSNVAEDERSSTATRQSAADGVRPSSGGAGAVGVIGMCAEGTASVTPVTPTVWLIVDGSSSMDTDFATGSSRWETLRSTLMSPSGIVASLQRSVRFGMVIYSGSDDSNQCVNLLTVQPALDNYAALEAMYPMRPISDGTPTDKALDHVFTNLPVLNVARPDAPAAPVFVILATDGAPNDMCGGGRGGGGGRDGDAQVEQRVVDVTAQATQRGANVFIISLAGADQRLQSHLNAVASVTSSKQPPYVPATQAELIAALRAIVGGGTCQVSLNGSVAVGRECDGQVLLNGQPLACGSDNGWRLTNPSTLQLTGTACEAFLSNPSLLSAIFPCRVFVPI